MNLFNFFLIVLIIVLVMVQPALKDKPFAKKSDNIELTKAVDNLLVAKDTQAQAESYNPEKIQNKIDELELKKYTLGTGINWGQCRNETGKTLAVYGSKPDLDDDDRYSLDDDDGYCSYDNTLYFLAAGQTTKNKWDCDGVYLPNDVRATNLSSNGQGKELGSSVAVKIADGTNLVVKTNPETAALELNVHPPKVFKAGEVNWFIPNVPQAVIDTRVPNAPAITKYSHSSRNFKL